MSGDELTAPIVVLPAALSDRLGALNALTAPGMPTIAVIGGTGVNIRLSTSAHAHRATADIDVVAEDHDPTAVEVLAEGNQRLRENTVLVDGVEIDVIATAAVSETDLLDIDDDSARLFVAWGSRFRGPTGVQSASPCKVTTPRSSRCQSVHPPVSSPPRATPPATPGRAD